MMARRCDTCQHFRPDRRGLIVDGLKKELLWGADGVNSKATNRFGEEEEAHTSDRLSKRRDLRSECWEMRPAMAEYCGVEEHKNLFYVCDVKEPACQQYQVQTVERTCDSCIYCRRAHQQQEDLNQIRRVAHQEGLSKVFGQNLLSGGTRQQQSSIESERNFAIEKAFKADTSFDTSPQYFSTCKRMDFGQRRTLCAWANPAGRCSYWSAGNHGQQRERKVSHTEKFELGGFHFEQTEQGCEVHLAIYGVRFERSTPLSLQFRLDWIPVGAVRTLAGIWATGVTVHRQRDGWLYRLDPGQQAETNKNVLAPTGGYHT